MSETIRFTLTDDTGYETSVGLEQDIYTIRLSRSRTPWQMKMQDCVEYCRFAGFNLLLDVSPEEQAKARELYAGHSFRERVLRPYEPRILVHSTGAEGYESIRWGGCLLCWQEARNRGMLREDVPIGYMLGDPEEYRRYVMLGGYSISGEVVVASREKGGLIMDPEAEYHPGARLYFDAAAMAKDGLLIRDGAHLKVERELPLQPYLLWVLEGRGQVSAPARFTRESNEAFWKQFPQFREEK